MSKNRAETSQFYHAYQILKLLSNVNYHHEYFLKDIHNTPITLNTINFEKKKICFVKNKVLII